MTGVMTGPGCLGLSHGLPRFRSTQHWAGCRRGQKTHHCPCPQFPSLLLQRPAGPQSVLPATPTSSQKPPFPLLPPQSLLGQVSGREIGEVWWFGDG